MLLFPSLILGSALFWAYVFYFDRLISWQSSLLHALIAIAIFSAGAKALSLRKPPWARVKTILWHTVWLVAWAVWNIAACGNYLSQKNWGDPLGFSLLWQFARLEEYDFNEVLGLQTNERLLYWVLSGIVSVGIIYGWNTRTANTLAGAAIRRKIRAAVWPVVVGLGAVSVLSHPGALQTEPVVAFSYMASSFSDLNGMDTYRRISNYFDREMRFKYHAGAARPKTNVIVIVLDSLRADHLPFYGYERNTAPFLAAMIESGEMQKVENAFSACSESFCGIASILTSHPYHKISHDSLKLYEFLRPLGYAVDLILTGEHEHFAGLSKFYGPAVTHKWTVKDLAKSGRSVVLNDDDTSLSYVEMLPPANGEKRFMFFFLMSTHIGGRRFEGFDRFRPLPANSLELKKRWNSKKIADDRSPSSGLAFFETIKNHYDNGVLQGDWVVGKIFDSLRTKGYLDDAIVVVTSDHGDSLGEHNHLGHGYKLYNENIRIPLLIWDSREQSRLKNTRFASHVDIAPTIFSRLDLPIPTTWAGRSLYGLSKESSSVHVTRRGIETCAAALIASETSLSKLITCRGKNELSEELYNLLLDPQEKRNLLLRGAGKDPALEFLPKLRQQLYFFYGNVVNTCNRFDCVDDPSH